MNRHERRAQASATGAKMTACRVRARRGTPEDCFFCNVAAADDHSQTALAFVYFVGHFDEASMQGPTLCEPCLELLQKTSERVTAMHGGEVHNMNAPGAGKS